VEHSSFSKTKSKINFWQAEHISTQLSTFIGQRTLVV